MHLAFAHTLVSDFWAISSTFVHDTLPSFILFKALFFHLDCTPIKGTMLTLGVVSPASCWHLWLSCQALLLCGQLCTAQALLLPVLPSTANCTSGAPVGLYRPQTRLGKQLGYISALSLNCKTAASLTNN